MVKSKVPMNSCREKEHHRQHQQEPHARDGPSGTSHTSRPIPTKPTLQRSRNGMPANRTPGLPRQLRKTRS